MPKEFSRAERVAYQIQRELAILIARETGDPRLRGLTISEVQINSDLSAATVYVAGQPTVKADEVLAALRRAAGFLRKTLASRLRSRGIPRLVFIYDRSFDQAADLLTLIDNATGTRDSKDSQDQ